VKKTVCLMTSEESFLNNYGAALQGFALFETLRSMGLDVSIVRYNGYAPPRKYGFLKDVIKRIIRYKGSSYSVEQAQINKKRIELRERFCDEIEQQSTLFRSFQMENMQFYSEERMCWATLRKMPPICDYYVCGSDQIWNPYFHGGVCDPGYFLSFAPKGSKKIAYAPSTGTNEFPKSYIADFKKKTKDFSALSLRENTSAMVLAKLLGREVEAMLDPTMLVDMSVWRGISRVPSDIPEKYILVYRFSDNQHMVDAIELLAKEKHLPVISIPLSDVSLTDSFEKEFRVGPAEFVGLIRQASLVVTDSFHACVFSILHHSSFLVFPRESFSGSNASMNTRVEDILENTGLLDRYVRTEEEAIRICDQDISFTDADNYIEKERIRSRKYLETAIFG